MFVKYSGVKVFPSMIEEVILKNALIAKCAFASAREKFIIYHIDTVGKLVYYISQRKE